MFVIADHLQSLTGRVTWDDASTSTKQAISTTNTRHGLLQRFIPCRCGKARQAFGRTYRTPSRANEQPRGDTRQIPCGQHRRLGRTHQKCIRVLTTSSRKIQASAEQLLRLEKEKDGVQRRAIFAGCEAHRQVAIKRYGIRQDLDGARGRTHGRRPPASTPAARNATRYVPPSVPSYGGIFVPMAHLGLHTQPVAFRRRSSSEEAQAD